MLTLPPFWWPAIVAANGWRGTLGHFRVDPLREMEASMLDVTIDPADVFCYLAYSRRV
jgi:hypothetical protein